jgi:hypothetical protein
MIKLLSGIAIGLFIGALIAQTANVPKAPYEPFTVEYQDDCYIEHDGVEMKLISVDDLKEKLQ